MSELTMKQPPLKIILFLLSVQGVILYAHWVLYSTLVFAFMPGPLLSSLLWYALLILSISMLVMQLVVGKWQSRVFDLLYTVSSVWIGTLQFLMMACLAFWLALMAGVPSGALPPWRPLGAVLFISALLTSAYAVARSFRPQYARYYVKMQNLPEEWRGRKAVVISDVHLGNIRANGSAKKLVRMANAENPDIVFIPGDLFDGPPADYEWLAAPLSGIKAPLGTYFTEGNHEEFRDPERYLSAIRAAGVNILKNEMVMIGGMQILGVPYEGSNEPEEVRDSLAKIPFDPEKPNILLKHAPSAVRAAAMAGIDLMLCGHTHKGQMWPYSFLVRRLFGKAGYGQSQFNNMQIITTSGFGTWGPPQRWGTRAEVVVIKFL